MAISKVYLNSDVQMDITDTTATQGQVASTAYYYGADGVKKQGSYVAPSAVTQATPTISVNTSTGLITASATQGAGVVSAGTKSATEQLSTENGKTVTPTTSEQTAVAANKYTLGAIKVAAMPAGSAATPATSITANPSISVSSGGLITATASATKSVTPTVSAGYVSSGSAGTITVSGSNTEQLSTQAAQTLYPSTTDQTISSGKYLTGTQTFKGVLLTNLTAGNIKKDVVVKVGDSADDDRITSVTGTYEGSGGGSTEVEQKDVNFIDYDGTILYSYTKTEFANLSALPANPSHTGLTAQGWNWSLSDAKTYVADYGKLWIGQMYITSSGATEIDIVLEEGRLSPYLGIAVNGEVDVDWGDGSTHSTVTGTSLSSQKRTLHEYSTAGAYTIKISVTNGSFAFSSSSAYGGVLSKNNTSSIYNYIYCASVVNIRLGSNASIGSYAFVYCRNLSSITMPSSITSIESYTFRNCTELRGIVIPSGVTAILNSVFQNSTLQTLSIPNGVTALGTSSYSYTFQASSLRHITLPKTVTRIYGSVFASCDRLASITIPDSVTQIDDFAFSACSGLASIHFTSNTPPTVSGSSTFQQVPTDCIIYVPYSADHSILAAYQSATNYPSSSTYTYMEES